MSSFRLPEVDLEVAVEDHQCYQLNLCVEVTVLRVLAPYCFCYWGDCLVRTRRGCMGWLCTVVGRSRMVLLWVARRVVTWLVVASVVHCNWGWLYWLTFARRLFG